jgi:peptide/nickel transport system substrate-binding protein
MRQLNNPFAKGGPMKKLICWIFVFVFCGAFAWQAAAAERGGTLNFGRYRDSNFLDPVLCEGNANIWILTNIYDTLLRPTTDAQGIGPGLATEWKFSDDKLSFMVKLRAGIKYSDGTPLKAEDVKWSIDRARNPKNGVWNSTLRSIESIEVTGPDTVTFKLKNPDPTLEAALATFNAAIMPKELFAAAPGNTMEEKAKAFAENPIGTGPFVLAEWKRSQTMRLVPNKNYWEMGEDGKPLPYLAEIRFYIIPDDATRLLKLQAGLSGRKRGIFPGCRTEANGGYRGRAVPVHPHRLCNAAAPNTTTRWHPQPARRSQRAQGTQLCGQ